MTQKSTLRPNVPGLSACRRDLGESPGHAGPWRGRRVPLGHVRGRRRLPAHAAPDVLRHSAGHRRGDRRQSDRRLLGVRGARAMAAGQYRFPHGPRADRRRRRRRHRRRAPGRAVEQARPRRRLHLARLCDLSRRDRLADACRELPRHVADARRQARHDAQARRATPGSTGCRSRCASSARASISAPFRR